MKVKLVYSYYVYKIGVGSSVVTETRGSQFDLTVLTGATATYGTASSSASARYNPGSPDTPLPPADGFDYTITPTVDDPAPADFAHHRGALLNVRYGQGHTSVVKPFIVVEGSPTSRCTAAASWRPLRCKPG